MERQKRWSNPYIHLVTTLPDYILGIDRNGLSECEVENLRRRCSLAPRVYLDLGSGSGEHLLSHAQRDPLALWIGFELRFKRAFRTAEKAGLAGLDNVLVLKTDARKAPAYFAPNSIEGVYVNFPDPWAKRRWLKHRILTPEFLSQIYGLLKPGGFLSYKTDHPDAFGAVVESLKVAGNFQSLFVSNDLHRSQHAPANVKTEFERLFVSQGQPINFLLATKGAVSN